MNPKLLVPVLALSVAWALTSPAVDAAGLGRGTRQDTAAAGEDSSFAAGKKALKAGEYEQAVANLTNAVEAMPKSADAFNLLGYGYLKLGRYDEALENYEMALAIDPKHRGAHEYIGEAYLKMGNLAKAEHHLDRLDGLCFFGCKEYSDLKKAIAEYKAEQGA